MASSRKSRLKKAQQASRQRKRRQVEGKRSPISARSANSLFRDADELMRRGNRAELEAALREIEDRFPADCEVLSQVLDFHIELDSMVGVHRLASRGLKVAPRSLRFLLAHAGSSMSLLFPLLALESFEQLLQWHPEAPELEDIVETMETIKNGVQAGLYDGSKLTTALLASMTENERLQAAQLHGRYEEAEAIGERALQDYPDSIPIRNNLTTIYAALGHWAKAVAAAEAVLETDPNNLHAVANLARLHFCLGHSEQTRQLVERLLSLPNGRPDAFTKKAETLSFTGDDEAVLRVFGEYEKSRLEVSPTDEAKLLHYAAVVKARRGDDLGARKFWQESLNLDADWVLAQKNLHDLAAPIGERNGPFAHPVQIWLPVEGLGAWLNSGKRRRSGREQKRLPPSMISLLTEFRAALLGVLERGDDAGRQLVVLVAPMIKDAELFAALKDFALSKSGTDERRHDALMCLSRQGLLDEGPHKLWLKGAWTEIRLLGFELHGEPTGRLAPPVQKWLQTGFDAMHAGNYAQAEQCYQKALALAPEEPTIHQNVAALLLVTGKVKQSHELYKEIYRRWPDYLHGRMNHAIRSVQAGNVAEARRVIEATKTGKRLHFSEFSVWCSANLELALAEENRDAARGWLDLWKQGYPDDRNLHHYQEQLRESPAPARWK